MGSSPTRVSWTTPSLQPDHVEAHCPSCSKWTSRLTRHINLNHGPTKLLDESTGVFALAVIRRPDDGKYLLVQACTHCAHARGMKVAVSRQNNRALHTRHTAVERTTVISQPEGNACHKRCLSLFGAFGLTLRIIQTIYPIQQATESV